MLLTTLFSRIFCEMAAMLQFGPAGIIQVDQEFNRFG